MPDVTFLQYMVRVQGRANLERSAQFPYAANNEEQLVMDAINSQLRYLNQKYYLIFKLTEYTLTTTAGTESYNLRNAPYSQSFFRTNRIAQHGVRRASDDWPLQHLEYADRDRFKPAATSSQSVPDYYTIVGDNLLFYPKPNGAQLKIRYYGVHIGKDITGTIPKLNLAEPYDTTMLEDEYQDCLVTMAAREIRAQYKVDEKYAELKRQAEDWERILIDMGNQTGEESGPELVLPRFEYNPNPYYNQYYPFGTNVPGA
jgi:hypothetical protein